MKTKESDMWMINMPILSLSCPYNSNIIPFTNRFIKDRCCNPANIDWIFFTYPECSKDKCPLKVI